MREEVGAQPVRRRPADLLAQVRGADERDLGDHRCADEQRGDHIETLYRRAADRVVDEHAQHLWTGELQQRAADQERAEHRDTHAQPREVRRERGG